MLTWYSENNIYFLICVMTRLCDLVMWRPCHVALGEVFGFEIILDILGNLVLNYFYYSCHVVNEIVFA